MRKTVLLAAAACVFVAGPALALGEHIPQADDFQGYQIGQTQPLYQGEDLWWNDSGTATREPGVRYTIIEEEVGNPGNQVARVVDLNSTSGKYTHLRTGFWFPTSVYITSGERDVYFDINPLRGDGAFKIQLTDHNGWTSAQNWLAGLVFGSTTANANNTYTPGMTNGVNRLGYQTKVFSQVWVDSGVGFTTNHWYTVRIWLNASTKEYQVFFGDRGGTLSPIMPVTPWVMSQGLSGGPPAGTQPNDFYGILFGTSSAVNDLVEFQIDNVYVTPEPSSMIALAVGGVGLLGLTRRRKS